MKNNRNDIKHSLGERGVALLMSLGILSLLIVIVVGFVFSSKTELLVAKVHDLDASARSFAEDNTSWLLAATEGGYGTHEPAKDLVGRYLQLMPAGSRNLWPLLYDYSAHRGKLAFKFDDRKDGAALAYDMGFLASPDVKDIKNLSLYCNGRSLAWWPFFSFERDKDITMVGDDGNGSIDWGAGGGNSQAEQTFLAGRYIFLQITEDVKFDLNGMLEAKDRGLCYGNYFNLGDILREAGVSDVTQIVSGLEARANLPTTSKKLFWTSWEHIWRSGFLTSDPDFPGISEERNARKAYSILTPYTKPNGEYYCVVPKKERNKWYTNRNGVKEPEHYKFYHRYYLGKLAVPGAVEIMSMIRSEGSPEARYFATNSDDHAARYESQTINKGNLENDRGVRVNTKTDFIPWLDFINGATENESANVRVRRQVVANLVDYSDADSKATTDYDSNDTNPATIEYCGLEKAPYVSAVAPFVQFTGPDIGEEEHYISKIGAVVNLTNIYSALEFPIETVKIRVKIPYIVAYGEEIIIPGRGLGDAPEDNNITVSCPALSSESKMVSIIKYPLSDYKFKANDGGDTSGISIPTVIVEVLKGSDIVDVCLLKNVGTNMGVAKDLESYPSSESEPYFIKTVFRDPRCNNYVNMSSEERNSLITKIYIHDDEDDGATDGDASDYNSSERWEVGFGPLQRMKKLSMHRKCLSGYRRDNELDGSISTARIRNGQIRSLWELGAIHRGEPWRTLNLKTSCKWNYGPVDRESDRWIQPGTQWRPWEKTLEFGNTRGCQYTGKYEHGDAAIMDQVKLTKEVETYPQINPFNPSVDFWKGVFRTFRTTGTNSPAVVSDYMSPTVNSNRWYIWESGLSSSEYEALIANTTRITGVGSIGATVNAYRNVINREGLPALFFDKFGVRLPQYSVKQGDLFEEEFVGKLADHLKIQHNFFRMVCSVQLLSYVTAPQSKVLESLYGSDEEDPRLDSFEKLRYYTGSGTEKVEWFKIRGSQKIMSMIYRFPGLNKFTILEKQIINSDYK